jgi:hypothetical protein
MQAKVWDVYDKAKNEYTGRKRYDCCAIKKSFIIM